MATELRTIATDGAPKAIGPYSQAMAAGELIFCAGQVALDPASGESVTGDVRAQTERVLENLSAVLAAAGSDLRHVVKTTVYLTDFNDFAAMNEVYAARFGDHRPARATVGVSALPKGLRVEIECVAIRVK
jgi:2-iminobutanoate/2-iminopropanoate deaminase